MEKLYNYSTVVDRLGASLLLQSPRSSLLSSHEPWCRPCSTGQPRRPCTLPREEAAVPSHIYRTLHAPRRRPPHRDLRPRTPVFAGTIRALRSNMGVHTRFSDDDEPQAPGPPTSAPPPLSHPTQPVPSSNTPKRLPASNSIRKQSGANKLPKRETTARHNSRPKSKSVKSQIRTINRLLENKGNTLTPSARKAKLNQLQELTRLRDEHDRRENERKMADKYRMLKFFERRKLQRVLDKIIQRGDRKEDEQRKKQVIRDLVYVTEYPKDQRYVALFPSGGHTEQSRRRVEDMRKQIEARRNGAAVPEEAAAEGDQQAVDDFFVDDPTA